MRESPVIPSRILVVQTPVVTPRIASVPEAAAKQCLHPCNRELCCSRDLATQVDADLSLPLLHHSEAQTERLRALW